MVKKTLILVGVILLAVGLASAQVNRDRGLPGETTTLSQIGVCEPETSAYAVGWDTDPTLGSWGGKDESQFAVVWEPGQVDFPTLSGRMATCIIPGVTGKTPKKVEMLVLEGLANDSYCAFASVAAGDLLIGCKSETSVSEVWVTHSYDLPANAFAPGQDVKITLLAAGNAWPSFSTWGQLAVDYIKILGE